jgi:alkyl hydroperoxide reductase subunit D
MALQQELHEAKADLLRYLKIDDTLHFESLFSLAEGESKFIRDIKVNLKNTLVSQYLSQKETALIALAIAINERNDALTRSFTNLAREHGAEAGEIAEVYACTSLLATNNVLYRFRHFAANEKYENIPARVKMTIMMNPVLGKELFELISLVVSAVNGCEACVNSHEASVRALGSQEERIFDAVRLGSVVRGVSLLIR